MNAALINLHHYRLNILKLLFLKKKIKKSKNKKREALGKHKVVLHRVMLIAEHQPAMWVVPSVVDKAQQFLFDRMWQQDGVHGAPIRITPKRTIPAGVIQSTSPSSVTPQTAAYADENTSRSWAGSSVVRFHWNSHQFLHVTVWCYDDAEVDYFSTVWRDVTSVYICMQCMPYVWTSGSGLNMF